MPGDMVDSSASDLVSWFTIGIADSEDAESNGDTNNCIKKVFQEDVNKVVNSCVKIIKGFLSVWHCIYGICRLSAICLSSMSREH